jgi:hypothetical protein
MKYLVCALLLAIAASVVLAQTDTTEMVTTVATTTMEQTTHGAAGQFQPLTLLVFLPALLFSLF